MTIGDIYIEPGFVILFVLVVLVLAITAVCIEDGLHERDIRRRFSENQKKKGR